MSQMSWQVDAAYGCWTWTGATDNRTGRPIVWRGRHPVQAHLVVYEQHEGRVPDELVLDHCCNRMQCVAPHHLEPVSQRENLFRKNTRYRLRLERCKRGHDLKLNGVVVPETGGRVCRKCNREASHGRVV